MAFVSDFGHESRTEQEQADNVHHRVRRQSEGIGNFMSNLGGRFTTMRDGFRDTVRPVAAALNPRPAFESFGKMMTQASTATMTRGRDMVTGVRDVGNRGVTRIRDGVTETWDSMRDGWEDFWDL